MNDVDFSRIRNAKDLARTFGCSVDDIVELDSPKSARLRYQQIPIPKKGYRVRGQYRIVYKVVDRRLRLLQKNLATTLIRLAIFPGYVHGFVPRRSIATNARQHIGRRLVLVADIR